LLVQNVTGNQIQDHCGIVPVRTRGTPSAQLENALLARNNGIPRNACHVTNIHPILIGIEVFLI